MEHLTPALARRPGCTVSGPFIKEIQGSRQVGYSQVGWDGLDEDHDEVANGTYVYRITARWRLEEDEFTGRLVRARD